MNRSRLRESIWAAALAVFVAAALALAGCGSDTATTETAAPSPSVAVTVSSTPTPTPTSTWTPGAKPIPAATFPPAEGTTDVGEASFGWAFKPTVDIQVTHLGYYDDGANGLRHAHPVGIYDFATKKLLVRGTVRRDSPLEASFRFVKVTPTTLRAGTAYIVVTYAMPPFDPEVNAPDGLEFAPETGISVADAVWPVYPVFYVKEGAKRLVYPTVAEQYLYMTPNFKFRPLSAASPSP